MKIDEEAIKDSSADQKSPGIAEETEKVAETADKTAEDMEVTMETSEKTQNEAEKTEERGNGEKAIEENDKSVEELSKSDDAEKAVAQDDKTTEGTAESAEDKKVELDKKEEEILEKKVKKEKLEEGEEGPGIKADVSTAGPKIVGVTSAVGMEDIKPKPSSERKKSTGKITCKTDYSKHDSSKPILFWKRLKWYRQKVLMQIRCHMMWHLIRVSTILQVFFFQPFSNENIFIHIL